MRRLAASGSDLEIDAAHADVAGVGREDASEHPQRGRLAGAVGPEEADDLPGVDAQAHVVDGV